MLLLTFGLLQGSPLSLVLNVCAKALIDLRGKKLGYPGTCIHIYPQPKQCNNWKKYSSGAKIPDLSSVQTRFIMVCSWQQSSWQSNNSSHIWWSCSGMNRSSKIPLDWLKHLQPTHGKVQKCRYGLWVLKSMATKGIEQLHLYLLY